MPSKTRSAPVSTSTAVTCSRPSRTPLLDRQPLADRVEPRLERRQLAGGGTAHRPLADVPAEGLEVAAGADHRPGEPDQHDRADLRQRRRLGRRHLVVEEVLQRDPGGDLGADHRAGRGADHGVRAGDVDPEVLQAEQQPGLPGDPGDPAAAEHQSASQRHAGDATGRRRARACRGRGSRRTSGPPWRRTSGRRARCGCRRRSRRSRPADPGSSRTVVVPAVLERVAR